MNVPGLSKRFTPDMLREHLISGSIRNEDGCLIFSGYGDMGDVYQKTAGRAWAHVASYEVFNGPRTPGLDVAHTCGRPDCIEPSHLTMKSRSENCLEDSVRRGSACEHPRERNQQGKLIRCKRCNAEAQRRWRNRHGVSR